MSTNLFDYFEEDPSTPTLTSPGGHRSPAAKTSPPTSCSFDRISCSRATRSSANHRAHRSTALHRCGHPSWQHPALAPRRQLGARRRRRAAGRRRRRSTLADLAHGQRFSVQFWDANATKALHIGHLRNLAIGNSLAAALQQSGAHVERRSRISDMGRGMGEAMGRCPAQRSPRPGPLEHRLQE